MAPSALCPKAAWGLEPRGLKRSCDPVLSFIAGRCQPDTGRAEGRLSSCVGHHGRAGDVMAPKQAAMSGTDGKRRARRTGAKTPTPSTTRPPDRERRLVDVDPWAMLLEQLMEAPEGD